MSIFDYRLFFVSSSSSCVPYRASCHSLFCIHFVSSHQLDFAIFHSFLPLFSRLLIALSWFYLLLFHICDVGLRCGVPSPYNTAPRTVLHNGQKPLGKNRGLVVYSHKYSELRELRELRDSSTQSYPSTTKKQPFSTLTVRWITEEDRNKNAIRGNSPETIRRRGPVCSSSTLTFEKHRRPMWHSRIGTGSAATWTLFDNWF